MKRPNSHPKGSARPKQRPFSCHLTKIYERQKGLVFSRRRRAESVKRAVRCRRPGIAFRSEVGREMNPTPFRGKTPRQTPRPSFPFQGNLTWAPIQILASPLCQKRSTDTRVESRGLGKRFPKSRYGLACHKIEPPGFATPAVTRLRAQAVRYSLPGRRPEVCSKRGLRFAGSVLW